MRKHKMMLFCENIKKVNLFIQVYGMIKENLFFARKNTPGQCFQPFYRSRNLIDLKDHLADEPIKVQYNRCPLIFAVFVFVVFTFHGFKNRANNDTKLLIGA